MIGQCGECAWAWMVVRHLSSGSVGRWRSAHHAEAVAKRLGGICRRREEKARSRPRKYGARGRERRQGGASAACQDKSDLVGDGANRHHTQSTEAAVRGAKQADGKQYGRQPVPLRPTIPKSGDARAPVHRTGPSSTGWLPSSASASQRLYGFGFDNPGNAGSLLRNLVRSGWYN